MCLSLQVEGTDKLESSLVVAGSIPKIKIVFLICFSMTYNQNE